MKTINLPALTQITFEEIGGFCLGSTQPASAASLAQMQKSPPIRTSKLNPMLKTSSNSDSSARNKGGSRFFRAARTICTPRFLSEKPC